MWLTSEVSGLRTFFNLEYPLVQKAHTPQSSKDRQEPPSARVGKPSPPLLPCKSVIFDLVRALAELERIGDTEFLIVRTPASTATWIITFIDWCLGAKPTVRGLASTNQSKPEIVHEQGSQVLVEIFQSLADLREPDCITFKKLGCFKRLLGESQSFFKTRDCQLWMGMIKFSTYFRTRMRELQTIIEFSELNMTLKMLITELADRYTLSATDPPELCAKAFPPVVELLRLLSKLTGIDYDSRSTFEVSNPEAIRAIWLRRPDSELDEITNLFEELLVASLFENAHMHNELELYIAQRWKGWTTQIPSHAFSLLRGQLAPTDEVVMRAHDIDRLMIEMIGG